MSNNKAFDWSQLDDEPATQKFDWSQLEDKPQEEMGFLNKLPRNIGAGVAEMGRGLANAPHNIANMFGMGDRVANLADPDFDYSQAFGLPKQLGLSDKIIQSLAQNTPAFALGGANLARQALVQAAFGATQDKNPVMGAAEGGAGALAGGLVGKGLEKGYNALRPSKLLRGHLSPEELARNLEVTKGTESNLGRIIGSPSLNRVSENILPHTFGSGAEDVMQRNAKAIEDTGTKLIKDISSKTGGENFGVKLQDALKQASQDARAAKNANYDELNKIADKSGLKIGRDSFQKTAQKVLGDIEQSEELKHEFGKDLYSDLIRYARNPLGNNLKLTNIFKGKLGDKANELYRAGKMHEYGILKDLTKSLDSDIQSAFEQSGNPKLKAAYDKAQREYKENFAPFEDKDIVKFTRQGGDPDLILQYFLRGGANDRSHLLSKLDRAYKQANTGKSQKQNYLLSSAYLSKALNDEGKVNPLKFRTLYNKLGQEQRKILFGSGKFHEKVKNYADLVGKNAESFSLMANPKTGARTLPMLQGIHLMTNPATGIPLAIGARAATKALTSPKLREKLVKAMIENKPKSLAKTKKALTRGAAFAASSMGRDSEQKPLEIELVKGRRY